MRAVSAASSSRAPMVRGPEVLAELMNDPKATASVRAVAAEKLLDRAYGKPPWITPCKPMLPINRSTVQRAMSQSLRVAIAARPCAHHRPRSSPRRPDEFRSSARRRASRGPIARRGGPAWRHGHGRLTGDRQNLTDRLDPVRPTMIVDKGDHGLYRRSSSAWAK
jgi:hypothetical protein